MTRWRKFWAAAVLAIPLVAMGLLATKALYDQKSYPLIQVKIAGYDPRDMLRGHYLRYQFDWNWEEGQPDISVCDRHPYYSYHTCCLCLSGDRKDPQGHLVSCKNPEVEQCPAVLEGRISRAGRFDIGHNQYFVPERHARALETLLRDEETTLRIGLSVHPNGRSAVETLYVESLPLDKYLNLYGRDLEQEATRPLP
ncbi:MAG: GDYXXLXY domain-containing protein [Rhodospirillales bacterium]|nr:GDYXXLXY domain-containing protein [Alphaproteobacteria bacterium]USO04040.1 MAG: GDYXXLXY domain-containing protein [Rhodospirillales bacterium]